MQSDATHAELLATLLQSEGQVYFATQQISVSRPTPHRRKGRLMSPPQAILRTLVANASHR